MSKVNHPDHYNQGGIECIDGIKAALSPEEYRGFLRGNIIKYVWRANLKGGIEDYKKAEWYLEKLIEIGEENANANDILTRAQSQSNNLRYGPNYYSHRMDTQGNS